MFSYLQIGTETVTDAEWGGLVWLAITLFSVAMILIGVIWNSQVKQQKEALVEQKKLNDLVALICMDIAVIKKNGEHITDDVTDIKRDVDEIRREVTGIDKRVTKLEVAKG